jgi:Fic family protein
LLPSRKVLISLLKTDAIHISKDEAPMVFEFPELGVEEEVALAKIADLRKELRHYVAEPRRWVGSVRRMLAARAIQGSNSIEGYNVSVEDAVAAIEDTEPVEARSEDWHAVMGYRRAMTYVLQLAEDEHFELSAPLVRSLHFMMAEYDLDASPGLWRPGPIWIRNDATGEVVYEGPDAEELPALVDELVAQLILKQDAPPIVRGAMAHLNLVMIHPFRDGNGRMARCLQTLVLARDRILAPAWCSIEEYLGANTQRYYDVLGQVGEGEWNPQNDARPWLRFCLEAHYIQAMSVLRRVRESERMWTALEALIEGRRGLPERAIQALFDATLGLRVRNASYRSVLKRFGAEEVSHQVATSDLRALVDAGLLEQHGKKRGTYYVAGEPLAEIRSRARERRQPLDASSLFVAESASAV